MWNDVVHVPSKCCRHMCEPNVTDAQGWGLGGTERVGGDMPRQMPVLGSERAGGGDPSSGARADRAQQP